MNPYVGLIILFGGNFAPSGYAFCHGQLLAISQNATLFNLIGTTYGGDGQSTFALPDLQGRLAIHQGSNGISNYTIGQKGGSESITISQSQMAAHNHALLVSNAAGTTGTPANSTYLATPFTGSGPNGSPFTIFNTNPPATALAPQVIGNTGGGQPVSIIQPVLAMNYCISLFGIFPSRN